MRTVEYIQNKDSYKVGDHRTLEDAAAYALLREGHTRLVDDGDELPAQQALARANLGVEGYRASPGKIGVVIAGDSITQENFILTNGVYVTAARWFNWANALLGQPFELLNNAGYSGQKSGALLNRIDSPDMGFGTPGALVSTNGGPGVTPFKPEWAFIHVGVNDIYLTTVPTVSEVTGNLAAIYDKCLKAGIKVAAMTIMAVNSATSNYSAERMSIHMAVNEWIRQKCRSTPGLLLIDAFAATVNPLDATNIQGDAGIYRDSTLHPNNIGGYRVGKEIARVFGPILTPNIYALPFSNLLTDQSAQAAGVMPINLIPNPLLTGSVAASGGVASGNVPNSSLTLSNGSGVTAAVYSVEARADGYGQNLVCDITANGTGGWAQNYAQINWPSQHARVVAGGKYYAVCELTVQGASGAALTASQNLAAASLRAQFQVDGVNYHPDAMYFETANSQPLTESHTIIAKTNTFTVPAGALTVARPYFLAYFTGAGAVRIKIGRIALMRTA